MRYLAYILPAYLLAVATPLALAAAAWRRLRRARRDLEAME